MSPRAPPQHVDAKRYLVATRPWYAARLSEASRGWLAQQGGAMSEAECAAFAEAPWHTACLRVRAWDEAAKIPGVTVAGFDSYLPRLEAHLR